MPSNALLGLIREGRERLFSCPSSDEDSSEHCGIRRGPNGDAAGVHSSNAMMESVLLCWRKVWAVQ